MGIVNRNSEQYRIKCAAANLLPFGIALDKGGRIELIAMNYDSLKQLLFCVDFLAHNKKQMPKI